MSPHYGCLGRADLRPYSVAMDALLTHRHWWSTVRGRAEFLDSPDSPENLVRRSRTFA